MILKRKYRYVLVFSTAALDTRNRSAAILAELMRFMGELGYSEANPKIVAQYTEKLFVIRTNRGFEGRLILALSFIRTLSGARIGLSTLKTSGTIKSLMVYTKQLRA